MTVWVNGFQQIGRLGKSECRHVFTAELDGSSVAQAIHLPLGRTAVKTGIFPNQTSKNRISKCLLCLWLRESLPFRLLLLSGLLSLTLRSGCGPSLWSWYREGASRPSPRAAWVAIRDEIPPGTNGTCAADTSTLRPCVERRGNRQRHSESSAVSRRDSISMVDFPAMIIDEA